MSLFLLPGLAAQSEEIRPAFNLGKKIEQPFGGFGIVSPGLQQFLQRRDGLSRLAQVQVLHPRQLHEVGAPLERRHVCGCAPAQHRRQFGPALGRGQPIDQAVERLAVVGIVPQACLPQPDRALGLAPSGGQARGLAQQATPCARHGFESRLSFHHIEKFGRVLFALQELGQLAQGREYLSRLRGPVLHHFSIERARI